MAATAARSRTWRRTGTLLALGAGMLGLALSGHAGRAWSATTQDAGTPASIPLGPVCQGTGFLPAFQVVLAAAPGPDGSAPPEMPAHTQAIVARRAAAISPNGCAVWRDDDGRLLVQLAAVADPGDAIQTLSGTARLEIVDTGGIVPEIGAPLRTATGAPPPPPRRPRRAPPPPPRAPWSSPGRTSATPTSPRIPAAPTRPPSP